MMDKNTKSMLLVIGGILVALLYCAFMLVFMLLSPWAQKHPIIIAAIFALFPSLVSGSIWLISSAKAKNRNRLGF